MDWRSFAPYWIPAIIAVIAVALLALAARKRSARRSGRRPPVPSSSVDPFYLDSSHAGEPETQERPRRHRSLAPGRVSHGRHRGSAA